MSNKEYRPPRQKPDFTDVGDRQPDPEDMDQVKQGFWPKVTRLIRKGAGKVPFLDDAVALYYCAMDPATPRRVKAIAFAALAYFVVPTDMIPDVLAMVGFTDDASVVLGALGMIGSHVKDSHREQARAALLKEPESLS